MANDKMDREYDADRWNEAGAPVSSGVFPVASPGGRRLHEALESVRRSSAVPQTTDDPVALLAFVPRQIPRLRELDRRRKRLLAQGELLCGGEDRDARTLEAFLDSVAAYDDDLVETIQDALLMDIGGSG